MEDDVDIFQRRTTAKITKTMVAIPDIIIKIVGTVVFPSRSVAEDKTDNTYATIPKIASVLFFIDLLY